MSHSLVAIGFALACVAIGLGSRDKPAGQTNVSPIVITLAVVIVEAAVGLLK